MLPEDVQLQQSEVTALAGRAQVREFLGRLGYDTAAARETFAQAEGMPQRLDFVLFEVRWADSQRRATAAVHVLPRRFGFDRERPGERLQGSCVPTAPS